MEKDFFGEESLSQTFAYQDDQDPSRFPLAHRMRPQTLDDIIGQEHILGADKLLSRSIRADRLSSLIFYGPPGSGKTTLAHVISRSTKSEFRMLNAVLSNIQDIRKVLEEARRLKFNQQKKTILFIDEIHRFNKAQQDVLMPEVESGNVILIGATTQNPSFSINTPLLSRSMVFELKPLTDPHIVTILKRAITDKKRGLGQLKIKITDDALMHLAKQSNGDARRALSALEVGVLSSSMDSKGVLIFDIQVAEESIQKKAVYYDHDGDYHYDAASAFIKSIRGSDPDAAIYWLAKMLHAGEEPRFIIRRLAILASEDIGNADPRALVLAASALQVVEFVGLPEARITLAQLVTYLASAPKSNAAYMALENAASDVEKERVQEVPAHLRDSHYRGAKKMGHGVGYQYPHDHADHFVKQEYMPNKKKYYQPSLMGEEKKIKERLDELEKKRREAK